MNLFIQYWAKLSRAAAVASVAAIMVAFASMSGPAYADHDPDHLDDLKGRIGDIERQVWDCEHNTGDCVTVDTNAATICNPGFALDGSGACVAITDTLDDLSCTPGQTIILDDTDEWACSDGGGGARGPRRH